MRVIYERIITKVNTLLDENGPYHHLSKKGVSLKANHGSIKTLRHL